MLGNEDQPEGSWLKMEGTMVEYGLVLNEL